MNKSKVSRKIKRNLFYSKMHLYGLTLSMIGKMMSPPVCKVRVFEIIYTATPDYRLREIAGILKTNVQTLWPKERETVQNG